MTKHKGFPKYYEMDDDLFVKIDVDQKNEQVFAVTNKGNGYGIGKAMSEGKKVTEKEFNESNRQQ